MDRLTAMAVFAEVVETRSFSAAASRLGLSTSTASKYVAHLERHLGVRLLHRTTRRVSLTEAGAAFYERATRIVGEMEDAETTVSRLRGTPRGVLRVNAPTSFGTLHLAPAIPVFLARYPEVRVDASLDDRVVDLVEGGFDVAVRVARSLPDSSLVARRLAPNRLVVCAAPPYWKAHGKPRTPADLAHHVCLRYTHLTTQAWGFHGPRGEESVVVSGSLQANNGEVLAAAAVAGLGVAHLPSFIVGPALAAGALEPALDDYAVADAFLYAVYPHRQAPPKVRVFVNFLATRFGPRPYWDRGVRSARRPLSPRPAGR